MLIILAILSLAMAFVCFTYVRFGGQYGEIALVMACVSVLVGLFAVDAMVTIEGNIRTIRTLSILTGKDCAKEVLEMYKKLYFWYWF